LDWEHALHTGRVLIGLGTCITYPGTYWIVNKHYIPGYLLDCEQALHTRYLLECEQALHTRYLLDCEHALHTRVLIGLGTSITYRVLLRMYSIQ